MRIERTKNASRNIAAGMILKILNIFMPFVMRTAMIYFMGVQYVGLNSLFTSILQVLNLVELGVGSAMVYSMYKPIAEDDTVTICALMKLYKIYYRVIGAVIAVIGLAITPFIPDLIEGDVPSDMNVYVLYLLNLAATVLSYWLFAYKNCLFQAHQRMDVTSKIMLVTYSIHYILQFSSIAFLKDYYAYVIAMLFTHALTNIVTAVVADKTYPDYKPAGDLDKEMTKGINQRVKDLFTSKIGTVIINSADTIVISAFLGLTALAIYQNYYFILTAVTGLVTIIFNACTAGIGNSIITETKEKNFNDLNKFTFIISWIAGVCTCCFLNLYQPFMKIWVKKENLMLEFSAVICFCIYYFVYEINQLLNTYKDAGGIWHEDRFRPLVTALSNLVMNLIMVNIWGLYGVLLSTVFSMLLIGMPWLFHNLFSTLFLKEQLVPYLKNLAFYVVMVLIASVLSFAGCYFINFGKWTTLILRVVVCVVVPNVFFLIVYRKRKEFKESVIIADRMTKGKLELTRLIKNNSD